VFLTPEYLGIAMDYATDGDMFQLVVRQRGLLEKDARWYFQQLITAVDYCHRMVRDRAPRLLLGVFQNSAMLWKCWQHHSSSHT
jgi:serine/threonine protein kinase